MLRAHPRLFCSLIFGALVLAAVVSRETRVAGQNPASLTVLSRDGRREIPITTLSGQETVALDDLASLFQLAVREEGGAITITTGGRTIILTPDQTIASVAGRAIALPSPPQRVRNRWMVPLDFITRALIPAYDTRLELRRLSHLLIVGDLRVPRVAVQQEIVGGAGRVIIESTPRATASVTQDSPIQVTVRFDADAIDVVMPVGVVPGFVQGYRTPDATSLAIDLGPRVAAVRNAMQVVDASARLVIDLLPQSPDAPAAVPVPPGTPVPPIQTDARPAVPTRPNFGSGPSRTIAIDAGHGGDDGGAKGPKGTLEKDITLQVARRLKAAVESRLGYRVLMTRDDDHAVAVTDRTALANNNKADLFISLHANASFRPSVNGATIFTASFDSVSDAPALVPETLPVFGGGIRDIELVPWNLAQIRYSQRSAEFADALVEQFRDRIPLTPVPNDRAPLRVLESANMPAVLVELGYLTNAEQEQQLRDGNFQALVAQSVLDAIVRITLGETGEGPSR